MSNTFQRVGVYGLIFNSFSQILIVKRSPNDSHPGVWEMPGGALEINEQPQQGALREIKEETNLNVNIFYTISTTSSFSEKQPEVQVVRISFLCSVANPASLKLNHEHTEYKWVNPNNITEKPLSDFLGATLQILKLHPELIPDRKLI